MCDCISYNRPGSSPGAKRPELILPSPPHIEGKPNGICVDACIADAILMLWSHGVETRGCCCGHNRVNPSVVVSESEDASRVARLLTEHDDRAWDVMQWRLVRAAGSKPGRTLTIVVEFTREEAAELEKRCERASSLVHREKFDPYVIRIFDKLLWAVRDARIAAQVMK